MTSLVTAADGRLYLHATAGMEPVFVADMPRSSSATATPHTGFALLVARLEPLAPDAARLARVRLPNGRIVEVRATAICPADNLAARRLLPAPADALRRPA